LVLMVAEQHSLHRLSAAQAARDSKHVPNKPKGKYHCSVCNETFDSENSLQMHNSSAAKHKVNLLAQQLKSSGSFHANLQGLQVSEFEEATNLEVGGHRVFNTIQ
jgi:hypothetical protein